MTVSGISATQEPVKAPRGSGVDPGGPRAPVRGHFTARPKPRAPTDTRGRLTTTPDDGRISAQGPGSPSGPAAHALLHGEEKASPPLASRSKGIVPKDLGALWEGKDTQNQGFGLRTEVQAAGSTTDEVSVWTGMEPAASCSRPLSCALLSSAVLGRPGTRGQPTSPGARFEPRRPEV